MSDTFSLSGFLRLIPTWVDDTTYGDATRQATYTQTFSLTDGNGTNQSNAFWTNTLSISGSANTTLDLRALTLSEFGATTTVGLSNVRMLLVRNNSANHSLTLAAGDTSGWSNFQGGQSLTVPASGVMFQTAPVGGINTTASSKTMKITNNGNTTIGVDVLLVGVQA